MSRERLAREYFRQTEAEAKVGKQIQTWVEFSAVPRGTTGLVISADKAGKEAEAYDVAIQ